MRKFFIIAGEVSGDIHGALLMDAMRREDPTCVFSGIGGHQMESNGLSSLFPLKKMSVMGFVEVLKHLRFFKDVEKKVLEKIASEKPERIILIDYPGFNLRLAEKVKRKFNIPITYYISPQIWAWKEKRINIIKQYVNQMLVIFPFEKKWYAERGVDVEWVGHPYLEAWKSTSKSELKSQLGLDPEKPLLTLFPGSRKQELDKHLRLCVDAAHRVQQEVEDVQIVLGLAHNVDIGSIQIPENIMVERTHPRRALEAADAAIVASGTSTLEAAIYGTPMVIIYKMNPLSWWISKRLVKTRFAGMPNLIADRFIVPELLQSDATPKSVSKQIIRLIIPGLARDNTLQNLNNVRDALGDGNASSKAATFILGNSA
ncbi:MAG: lipid-A-disaccharide synthase [Candidatus Marinimicrobia bacterium]|nr:lipid-A-disaccharide synthase [Candidatus Neomarinimicrobiota bacterium]